MASETTTFCFSVGNFYICLLSNGSYVIREYINSTDYIHEPFHNEQSARKFIMSGAIDDYLAGVKDTSNKPLEST